MRLTGAMKGTRMKIITAYVAFDTDTNSHIQLSNLLDFLL